MKDKISVIIPIYNAEDFISEAVKSVLPLEEVKEVILIEDNSKDNSLEICNRLVSNYKKVLLYRHPGGINKGEAASRNLGIEKSNCEIIAFLDADDWYYSNRFQKDLSIFQSDLEVKVTYSHSTINFPDGRVYPYGEQDSIESKLTVNHTNWETYRYVIENDLILGHVNANTVHRDVFKNGDFWDERLQVHADTEFWWRINRKYRFYPAELKKPVSAARRHDHNTIYKKSVKTITILLLVWMDNIGVNNMHEFEKKAVIYHMARAISNPIKNHFLRKLVLHGFQWFANALRPVFIPVFYRWGLQKFKLYKS